MMRPNTKIEKLGAKAMIIFPTIKTSNAYNNTGLGENRFVNFTNIGPAMANVMA